MLAGLERASGGVCGVSGVRVRDCAQVSFGGGALLYHFRIGQT